MANFMISMYAQAKSIATHPKHTKWLCPILLALDAVLCVLILKKIPYTEIDWTAYMSQISQYLSGERSYPKIKGGTGPLVYPAAHVYTYTALYHITDQGKDIVIAQGIFAVLYLLTLGIVMIVYRACKVPPYVYPMLVLSKRLHSIFMLRCFNDCFAVCFLWMSIWAYQKRLYTVGSLLYSWALGIKMSVLLALPAIGIVIFLTRGAQTGLKQLWMMLQLQILIAYPFLPVDAKGYLSRAFEFSRQFLFEWTVNWRFIGEDTFLSKEFSYSLLAGHATVLAIFVLTRWLKPAKRSVQDMIGRAFKSGRVVEPLGDIQTQVSRRVTPNFILTTILTANVVGMLFARSLHYQFYAYLAWATPFLLWRSGLHPVFQYGIWFVQEWAWNVYPSTDTSSIVVVGVLAVTVTAVWLGTGNNEFPEVKDTTKPEWYIK